MHNLKTMFDKIFDIHKQINKDLANFKGNILRHEVVQQFSN